MAIGTGILFLLLGFILVLDVIQVDLDFVDDSALGAIFIVVGILAIVLSLIVNAQRQRRTIVEERPVVEDRRRL